MMTLISRRRLLAAGAILPLSAAAFASSIRPDAPAVRPYGIVHCDYPILDLDGAPYERGRAYGAAVPDAIRRNMKFYGDIFMASKVSWEKAKMLSEAFLPLIRKHCPEAVDEMRGIAEGAGLDFGDILALNCRSEIMFANSADGCTCVVAPGVGCREGHALLAQSWDWYMPARSTTTILKIRRSDRPSILMVAEAGLIGGKGLNSEGVAVGLNATSVGHGRIGLPLHIMMRNVLDSTNANEALGCVAMVPRAGAGTFNIVTSDGFAMQAEYSPEAFDVLMSEGEPIVHTNHYLSPLLASHDAMKNFVPSTYTRLNRMRRLLKANTKPLDSEVLLSLLSDHADYPDSICYHEDPRDKGFRACTVYAMACDVTAGKLWITNGYPCEGRVSEFSL